MNRGNRDFISRWGKRFRNQDLKDLFDFQDDWLTAYIGLYFLLNSLLKVNDWLPKFVSKPICIL